MMDIRNGGPHVEAIANVLGMDTFYEIAGDVFVVRDSTQVKSATDNIGTYDPNNKDIRYAIDSINQNNSLNNSLNNYGIDRQTKENQHFPEILGNDGKIQEASRTLATAANDSRRSQSNDENKRGFPKEKFLAHLEVAARQQGTWIENVGSIGDKLADKGGAENEIYLSKDGKSYIKLNRFTLLDEQHNIEEFIDRLNSHNEFASNVPYNVLGFAEDSEGSVCIVLEQPIIRGREATQKEIDDFLEDNGYKKQKISEEEIRWTNGIYEIWDVDPANVLIDSKRNFYFIDAVINNIERLNQYKQAEQLSSDPDLFISNKKRPIYEQTLKEHRPDMSETEIQETLDFLHELEDNKEENAYAATAITWVANNSIRLPQDHEKVRRIFAEARKRGTAFFKTSKGELYGFLSQRHDIYLDEDIINAEHPIHEYTHLWDKVVQMVQPELWNTGVELMKKTSLWSKYADNIQYGQSWIKRHCPNGKIETAEQQRAFDNFIASEVHARLTGREGLKLLEELAEREGEKGIIAKLKKWILDVWKSLRSTFGTWPQEELDALTLEDFVKMTMRDFVMGTPLEIQRREALKYEAAMAMEEAKDDALFAIAEDLFIDDNSFETPNSGGKKKSQEEKLMEQMAKMMSGNFSGKDGATAKEASKQLAEKYGITPADVASVAPSSTVAQNTAQSTTQNAQAAQTTQATQTTQTTTPTAPKVVESKFLPHEVTLEDNKGASYKIRKDSLDNGKTIFTYIDNNNKVTDQTLINKIRLAYHVKAGNAVEFKFEGGKYVLGIKDYNANIVYDGKTGERLSEEEASRIRDAFDEQQASAQQQSRQQAPQQQASNTQQQ